MQVEKYMEKHFPVVKKEQMERMLEGNIRAHNFLLATLHSPQANLVVAFDSILNKCDQIKNLIFSGSIFHTRNNKNYYGQHR